MMRRLAPWLILATIVITACSASASVTVERTPSSNPEDFALTAPEPDAPDEAGGQAPTEITTLLEPGSGLGAEAQALLLDRLTSDAIINETIEHLVTVEVPEGPLQVFHYDDRNSFCAIVIGDGSASNQCSSNDQMAFGNPFLRSTSTRRSGGFQVWLSNAPDDAAFFVVESDTGSRLSSNVVNGTGFVITDEGVTPVEASLVAADGTVLWSDEVRT